MGRWSVTVTPTTAIAIVASLYVLRSAWLNVPRWVTREAPKDEDKDANDDVSSPSAIIAKLSEMFQLVSRICADITPDDMPWYKLQLCFLSYLHLQHELALAHPNFRREKLESEGDSVSTEELQRLRRELDLAHWAYRSSYLEVEYELRQAGYQMIRHDTATEPGRVAHFIAVNHTTKVVVVSLKGTSTFSDIVTDAIGQTHEHTLEHCFTNASTPRTIRCHEGMFIAAQMVADDTQHLLEKFFLPQQYRILITGHSLGAGAACVLGLLLRSRIAELRNDDQKLRVVAFATPACLDWETAMASQSFITSFVNNTDCVPRLSILNVVTMNKFLVKIDEKLKEKGMAAEDWTSAARYLEDITTVDTNLLMSLDEVENFTSIVRSEGLQDYALFVPGRVVYMWKNDIIEEENSTATNSSSDGAAETTTEVASTVKQPLVNQYDVRVLHGGMGALRHIELDSSMLIDHLAFRYKDNLSGLLEQRKQQEARTE